MLFPSGRRAQGAGLPLGESYLVEVSHILAVLQDPGVEGLPWVGKRRVESQTSLHKKLGVAPLVLQGVMTTLGSACYQRWDLTSARRSPGRGSFHRV